MTESDPWGRYGWLVGSVWLVFLVVPARAILTGDLTWPGRIAALGCLTVFAVVYILGTRRTFQDEQVATGGPRAWISLAVMVAMIGGVAAAVGTQAIGMPMFIMTYGMFAFAWRTSLIVAVTTVAVTFGAPALLGQTREWISLGIVALLVGVATAVTRIAIDRAERLQQEREVMNLVTERDRVARDVHDVLGHTLTVIAVKTDLAERLVRVDPERAAAELAEIHALTRTAIAEVRATVVGLRARDLDEELAAAGEAFGLAGIEADLPADTATVDRHRAVFAWVIREGVTNIIRHSGAVTPSSPSGRQA
ncbi:MAG: sensor histidine kinase [Propioniciclava sp.]